MCVCVCVCVCVSCSAEGCQLATCLEYSPMPSWLGSIYGKERSIRRHGEVCVHIIHVWGNPPPPRITLRPNESMGAGVGRVFLSCSRGTRLALPRYLWGKRINRRTVRDDTQWLLYITLTVHNDTQRDLYMFTVRYHVHSTRTVWWNVCSRA